MSVCQACLAPSRLQALPPPSPLVPRPSRGELPHLGRPPSFSPPHALASPALEPLLPIFAKRSSDVLTSISTLFREAGEEQQAADVYMQMTAVESGRSTEDYERRALLFERSGEMVASSKLKGERVLMELELLQEEVLESDEGRTTADYLMRAQIFSKSAEIFASHFFSEEALP